MPKLALRLPLFAVLFSPSIGLAQQLGGATGPSEPSLGRIIFALIVCTIVGAALILFIRQRLGAGPAAAKMGLGAVLGTHRRRRLRIIESAAISQHSAIVLLQCDDEEFLVGAGAQGFLLLDRRKASQSETIA
jgi:hypothetical protein